ncbi:MAG: 1A family penicillin-binding protein [uncultured bacterium (gcode 4)]|uniref:peptidoglycan glycosyltransferase n=1 Tax=uncultured bacterium (gcode 4) TaxID=1234023 RepID=K2GAD1_9BACT|nr:MAG: 1A family penicillin-binding protein [uncultured bacterium (gcode 4)]
MSKIKKILLYIFIVALLIFAYISYFLNIPLKKLPNSIIIHDSNQIEIWELIKDNKIRHREIKIEDIPDFYKKALVNIEDKWFYENNWISLRWILRSTWNNIRYWKIIEWGSTISSQYIRNNLWLNSSRWFSKKTLEFLYAVRLNNIYSKNEILEKYINQMYFWYLNYWLKSASLYYFWKNPENLTKAEQIVLIVIPKNIRKYDPYKNVSNFKKRFDLILNYLKKNKLISSEEFESIKNEKIVFLKEHSNKLPYITDFIKNNPGIENNLEFGIVTTIDYNLTQKIEEIWKNAIFDLSWKNVNDYWILIVERRTWELKVMIWWINYSKKEWQVNSTLALRQPWSTIKPFTYLLSFIKFGIIPEDTILDLPVNYSTSEWYSYQPKNYSTQFKWEVTVAEALAQSINVPAVKTLEKVGVKNLLNFLQELWIKSLNKDAEHYWLALTLWVWEVSLFELLQAYSIFPNDWNFCEIKFIKDKPLKCKKMIEKKFTDMINEILKDRQSKLPWYPVNSALDFDDKNIFVKTWTSRNFRDNWSIWYTDNYIIWVWAWNKDWSNMKWVSGGTWAWELFWRIVNYLEISESQKNTNIFIKNSKKYLEITNPLNNEKYKIDPFKSIDNQKIKLNFQTNIDFDKYFWFLNNKKVEDIFIPLQIWNHELSLKLIKNWEIVSEENIRFNVE